jgi:hypothetical protein
MKILVVPKETISRNLSVPPKTMLFSNFRSQITEARHRICEHDKYIRSRLMDVFESQENSFCQQFGGETGRFISPRALTNYIK